MILGLSILSAVLFSAQADEGGAALFEEKCATCHTKVRPNDTSSLIAPPIKGVMRHLKMQYTCKEDAVAFIRSYVMQPDPSRAVCLPEKIKRFGLMPSQKDTVDEEELTQIASWLYDNFPNKNQKSGGCLNESVPTEVPQESSVSFF
jgi:mono/diheme cytochrome c family protein